MRIISLLSIVSCLCFFSCSNSDEKAEEVKENEAVAVDSVKEDVWQIPEVKVPFIDLVDSLERSIVQYKAEAFASEEKKINATEELLKEIDQTAKSYFQKHFDEIGRAHV